jgi:prophage regulatory protein
MHQKYLRDTAVAKRYDISRITVWRWAAKGLLPKPVKLSPGCTRWRESDLDDNEEEPPGQ